MEIVCYARAHAHACHIHRSPHASGDAHHSHILHPYLVSPQFLPILLEVKYLNYQVYSAIVAIDNESDVDEEQK